MKFNTITSLLALASIKSVFANEDTEGTDADIPTIEVSGNKFFYSNNGSQFYIRGVAYQQDTSNATSGYTSGLGTTTFIDPLSDGDQCKRDIPYLKELDTNVIRVYAVNTTVSHKDCMDAFANAGIYVIADLSQPSESINRINPEWNVGLFSRYKDVVDSLSNYTNVLGFFAGNEVTNNVTNTEASAFVKAAVRDTKQYISDQGYRSIPVGYSANDDSDTRVAIANYFACGDEQDRVDFYGINMYSWCGDSTFQNSGYEDRTEEFANLSIPLFFSEYGCNEVQPRKFSDIPVLFSDKMTDVWSGGIIYMYFQEANDYGLVTIDGDTVSTLSDFNNLKSQMAAIDPTSATSSDVQETTLECPAIASTWNASPSLPPTPNEAVCSCLSESFSCIVSSDVDLEDYGDLFGVLCGTIDCSEISTNATDGEYGDLSFCNDETKLSFLLNKYYEDNGSRSTDCDFEGSATLTQGSEPSSCSAIIAGASASGGSNGSSGAGSQSSGASGSGSGSSATASSTSTGSSSGAMSLKPIATPSNMVVYWTAATLVLGALGVSLI